ncbi:MAG: NAD(P)H-dependent oxidoreductase subunit E [Deltaproteobacteria bacterium]|nr:NAD(P)H-dependent oxidoreductase subunit E [Deltaproteobacteria bacterium]
MSPRDVAAILARHPGSEEALIEILHDVQLACRHIPKDALGPIAAHVGVPVSRVYGVATFYAAFSFEKKGERVVRCCLGTACHVKGAGRNLEDLEQRLGIRAGHTTADGRFSLEAVNCVGACGIAPVVTVNDRVLPRFRMADLERVLSEGGE